MALTAAAVVDGILVSVQFNFLRALSNHLAPEHKVVRLARPIWTYGEIDNILDNIGLPFSSYNLMHSTSGVLGANDADVLVSLRRNHHPTAQYVRALRQELPREFPGTTFYFLPADIVTQILNFGLPAPIDIQVEGNNMQANHDVAENIMTELHRVRVAAPSVYLSLASDCSPLTAAKH